VSRWEQVARDAELEVYPFGVEDWLDELDGRQILDDLSAAVPGALREALVARVAEADSRVRAATERLETCLWGSSLAKRQGWAPDRQWWYWRRPRAVRPDFAGDA
jgi:hypothetical protein